MTRTITVFLLLLASALPCLAAEKKIKIAFLEAPRGEAKQSPMKLQLKRLGYKGYDVAPKIKEGRFKLSPYDVLLVGTHAMSDRGLQKWFRREAKSIRTFVQKGGVVLVFAQDCHEWDIEPWLPEKAFLLRNNSRHGALGSIEQSHPLFKKPHTLSLERLNADWKGDKGWDERFVLLRTIRKARPAHVLASQGAGGENPWCVEMGWGKGRCLFFSCAPDRPPVDAESPGHRICDAVMKNTLSYSAAVSGGDPHPLPEDVLIADEDVEKRIYLQPVSKEEEQAFKKRVDAAVDRGVAWLKSRQKENGSWGTFSDGWSQKYPAGLTSLSLLALLNSGVNKYDKGIEKGFEYVFANPPQQTYGIAFTLMAMEMRAAPMYERFTVARMAPADRQKYEFKRDLKPEERKRMEELAELLISHHQKGGSWRYNLKMNQHDISNGQFAVLGLKAASRCGIRSSKELWEEVLDYYIRYQAQDGPKTKYKEFKAFSRNGTPEFYVFPARARGWSYHFGYPKAASTIGSHVNIGLSCLVLSYEELMKIGSSFAKKNRSQIKYAIRDGLSWLTNHWCVEARPNAGKFYYHYYVYSLGRVGTLIENRFIGDHDWYREMAEYLLEKQHADGHWGIRSGEWGSDISSTSFTLLFLMRSTPPPVITVGK